MIPDSKKIAMPLQTAFGLTLPRGFHGPDGIIHKEGTMRLASSHSVVVIMKRVIGRRIQTG